jgi:glycosyltransferase involved in cell wall biosynthesis
MKVAIIHEWLSSFGGNERLLVEALRLYPSADVFALLHFRESFQNSPLQSLNVQTTFLQKLPNIQKHYRKLLPIMPFAIESLDVRAYDLVISLSHAVAHGVRTHSNQTHISYISTPMRYAWHMKDEYLNLHGLVNPFVRFTANTSLRLLRKWDAFASARSDALLANSHWTAAHILEAWGRDAHVIYPAVETRRFDPTRERKEYYLLVARLVPYKMSFEIVKAFNLAGLPLVIIGDGPEMPRIQAAAKGNIRVLGSQPDNVVAEWMNHARAFVYMAAEDFGIAMAEAQAAGCPVIAYGRGGAAEIVREGETGLLFSEQSATSMIEALQRFDTMQLSSKAASENAARFSTERFGREFSEFVQQSMGR